MAVVNRDKVIKGLQCCLESWIEPCPDECPYIDVCGKIMSMYYVMKDALTLLKEQQWHPYDPLVGDKSLKDHYYYLVMVRGRETPMKAKYHDDSPFGFVPVDGYFDGLDVTEWREIPGSED